MKRNTYSFAYNNALIKPRRVGKDLITTGVITVLAYSLQEARSRADEYYAIGVRLGEYKAK